MVSVLAVVEGAGVHEGLSVGGVGKMGPRMREDNGGGGRPRGIERRERGKDGSPPARGQEGAGVHEGLSVGSVGKMGPRLREDKRGRASMRD